MPRERIIVAPDGQLKKVETRDDEATQQSEQKRELDDLRNKLMVDKNLPISEQNKIWKRVGVLELKLGIRKESEPKDPGVYL